MASILRFVLPKRKTALDANTDELERLAIEHHKCFEALKAVRMAIGAARIERERILEAERERASKAKG